MYTSYYENYLETGSETILNDAREAYNQDKDDRTCRLYEFIDAFIGSEEYQEYLRKKRDISKVETSTQYSKADIDRKEDVDIILEHLVVDKYPLTTKSKKMFAFKQQYEKFIKNEEKRDVILKQEKAIAIIRKKIAQFEEAYRCTKDLIAKKREEQFKRDVLEFYRMNNMDFPSLLNAANRKVLESKIIRYKRSLFKRHKNQQNNIINIVTKLVTEEETINRKDPQRCKTSSKKIKNVPEIIIKKEKIKKTDVDLEYEGKDSKTEYKELKNAVLQDETVHPIETSTTVQKKLKSDHTSLESRQRSAKQSSINSKKGKSTKSKRSKSIRITNEATEKQKHHDKKNRHEFSIPDIPICNKRRKISQYKISNQLTSLLEEFDKLDDAMEDQLIRQKIHNESVEESYEPEQNLICTPEIVIFDNFELGKTYKKSVTIKNKAYITMKCVLKEMEFSYDYDQLYFHIVPLLDVIKLYPGCTSKFTIKFEPDNEKLSLIEGKLKFLSYNPKKLHPQIFYVNIRCVPKHVDLQLSTEHIDFGTIPYWILTTSKSKNLRLKNAGLHSCLLIFRRNRNPLELPETNGSIDVIEETESNENEMPEQKQTGKIDNKDSRDANFAAKSIIDLIIQDVFSYIFLENTIINLGALESVDVTATLRNIEHLGFYFEKYTVDVYEELKDGALIGSREILFTAEISGHILKITPEVVSFGACFVNSIYQTGVYVENTSSHTVLISMKYPNQIAPYVRCDVSSTYLQPYSTKELMFKFTPMQSLTKCTSKFYNESTSILDFPLYISVLSKNYTGMPPAKFTTMAVLVQPNSLQIRHCADKAYIRNQVLDLGICTIYETVFFDIEIRNDSPAEQMYGFLNLPKSVTLENFGFGQLLPGERKILRVFFHPGYEDVRKYPAEHRFESKQVNFTVKVDTIANLGGIKTELKYKNIKTSMETMLKQLKTKMNPDLYSQIQNCKIAVRNEYFWFENNDIAEYLEPEDRQSTFGARRHVATNIQIDDLTPQMSFTATICRPLLEFSHQHIHFPATSCGSYSFKEVDLRAFDGIFGPKCDAYRKTGLEKIPNYEAFFRIMGDNDEIKVEPTCGILTNGEIKKILLVATPSTPQIILENIAANTQALQSSTLNRERKSAKNQSVMTKSHKDVDYYSAEMLYWRTLKPYHIKSCFLCEIRYSGDYIPRPIDRIYLQADCKVIRPDFITDLKQQRIDFGSVPLGTNITKEIQFQNIKYEEIEVKPSIMNPAGPFSVPSIRKFRVPPEYTLQLPIKFAPTFEKHFEEYFEITSDRTTLALILEGAGVKSEFDFSPSFLVCRLEASKKGHAECVIQITNRKPVEIKLKIEKICEISGHIHVTTEQPTKKAKKHATKKITVNCLTDELTKDEEQSIRDSFHTKTESSNFGVFKIDNGDIINIDKGPSSVKVRICYGPHGVLQKIPTTITKEKSNASDVKMKELLNKKFKIIENTNYDVAKYTLKLGETVIKDFIFIGHIKGK